MFIRNSTNHFSLIAFSIFRRVYSSHYRDYEFDQNIGFIHPKVERTFSLNTRFLRFFEFEVGMKGALSLPTRVYNYMEFYKIETNYAMLHDKIPFSTEVEM